MIQRLLLAGLAALAVLALAVGSASAQAPRAQFRIDGKPHVGMPFVLQLQIDGFDESPPPALPPLTIPGAQVTPLGTSTPSVSRSIQIINGRRSESVRVTWVLQWRVQVEKEGLLRVPATTVTQGSKKATAAAGDVQVQAVPTTDAMKLSLDLPDRPVFVGETVPVTLTWLFKAEPEDQTFDVPILDSDAFTISAPALDTSSGRPRALTFSSGGKDLQLGFQLDKVEVGGAQFTRLRAQFFAAPRKVGKVDVPAASVVAALPVGRPDFFGNAPTRLFRAADVARTMEVKALPETDRPPTFAGAVGEQFSIDVRTSRSVVSLGEPMELDITIKSNQVLDTLALGRMDGEGRLPKDTFTVPADPPTGELSDGGKTKKFRVTAQVTGPATEVPALAFSYFDPTKNEYRTIHSEPIALSVKGGSFVGATDVVAAKPTKPGPVQTTDDTSSALVSADLALSTVGAASSVPLGGTLLWVLVGLLYAVPLALLVGRTYQLRTRDQREDAAEVRTARKKIETLLDRAGSAPAREIAGPLAAALRDLARTVGQSPEAPLIARLETDAFAPDKRDVPLSTDLRSDAAGLLRTWTRDARRAPTKSSAALVLLVAALAAPRIAEASNLDEGRAAYQQAMQTTGDPTARKAAFARAATALGTAAREMPGRPELLTDWGNAALGAGDVATATLAYRRALAIDGSTARARHNLAWLRGRQGDMFRGSSAGATDTLLFFHPWPVAKKLIVGGVAFALAILLLVPWTGGIRRWRGLAVVPAAIWIAMTASVVLADDHANDAVVMDDVIMRAADSAGAPPALTQPLPRGAEVVVREQRDAWTRIELASGTTGWVPAGSVERVVTAR